jgi:hypothetical protein
MRIENLRTERSGNRKRVAATVTWEDCDRPAYDLYFETADVFADSLSCNADAFLTGCVVPAMHYGEKRVAINGEVCPELQSGLVTVLSWLRQWYPDGRGTLVRIEAKPRKTARRSGAERAGLFFTGGVDSLAILRKNRLGVPPDHPRSFRDAVVAFGLELDDPQAFSHVVNHLSSMAQEAGLTLMPVYTNVYLPYRNEDARIRFRFWSRKFHGAALAAIAHALAGRLTSVSIAATGSIPILRFLGVKHISPFGTHPLLDPYLSSTELYIRHDGIELSRLDRLRLIADWDLALRNLRVCNQFRQYRADSVNCGRCDKCMRTKLALVALGALNRTRTFTDPDVSPELVKAAVRIDPYRPTPNEHTRAMYYLELLEPLARQGRDDLVRIIERKLKSARRRGLWAPWLQAGRRELAGLRRRLLPQTLRTGPTTAG